MLIPPISNNPSKVQLSRIAHVYFEHDDLTKFVAFSKDFGFAEAGRDGDTIYYRGYGRDPYVYVASKSKTGKPKFLGAAFVAATREDFEKASKISGATVKSLEKTPGGGEMVTVLSPSGTIIHVVYGQEERSVEPQNLPSATHESHGPFNTPFEKNRLGKSRHVSNICRSLLIIFVGQFQRYHEGPALVHKLGHYGYVCKEFDSEIDFYTSNFNFVPSDILHHPSFSNIDVLTFMHLDLGKTYSDHHVIFMQRAAPEIKKTYVHHTSYEVADFDTQLIGHEYLAKKGWKSVWGVGRHILGSQIFDYWHDSSGFKIEHYADGDVVNSDTPCRRDIAGPISIWGPELPKDFGDDGTLMPH